MQLPTPDHHLPDDQHHLRRHADGGHRPHLPLSTGALSPREGWVWAYPEASLISISPPMPWRSLVLRYPLIHPPLLGALARAGHGSVVLLADGNYPYATAVSATADTIWLNLRPGQIPVDDVLETLLGAVPVEAARVMATGTGEEPGIYERFRSLLPGIALQPLARGDFYAAARGPELAVAIATGEQRLYANILLTLGVVQ